MMRAYLQTLKAQLEESCPYEVRLAHSGRKLPEAAPFILLGVKSVTTDLSAAVWGSSIRYPVTAVITAAVYAPSGSEDETARILAGYVLPVMAGEKTCIQGISESSVKDDRMSGCHVLAAEFRIKGVYTIESEAET